MNESLSNFIATGSAEAFRQIVATHIDGVHAQCVRRLRDRALAEDVTQAVFVMLARQARNVPANAPLAGWLYVAARYACMNALRSESRRRTHERKAAVMRPEMGSASGAAEDREAIQSSLDDALAKLGEADRNAIVLRYLEERPMAEVGAALGVSEVTARQRVSRALDRLRMRLKRMGVDAPAAGLPGVLSGAAAWPTPEGLLEATVRSALAPPSGSEIGLIAKGACQMMAWTTIRIAAVWTVGVLGVAATAVAMSQAGGQQQSGGAGPASRSAPAEPAAVEIPAALQGEWVPTAANIAVTVTIKDGTLTFVADQERTVLDITRVDTTAEPHGIDGTIRENTLRGRPQDLPGTPYQLAYMLGADDLLRLALAPAGAPRPRSVDPTVERKALILKRKPTTTPTR